MVEETQGQKMCAEILNTTNYCLPYGCKPDPRSKLGKCGCLSTSNPECDRIICTKLCTQKRKNENGIGICSKAPPSGKCNCVFKCP